MNDLKAARLVLCVCYVCGVVEGRKWIENFENFPLLLSSFEEFSSNRHHSSNVMGVHAWHNFHSPRLNIIKIMVEMKLLDPAITLFSLFASCFLSIIFLNFHSILNVALFCLFTLFSSPTVQSLRERIHFKWDTSFYGFPPLVRAL